MKTDMSTKVAPLALNKESNILTLDLSQQAESQTTHKPFKMGTPDSFVSLLNTAQWLPQHYVSELVSDALDYYAENKANYAEYKAKQAKEAPKTD
tara:strand:+ start:739 stop:1023 length:285 start_codon:yes stop_codon:yes gene_type:complete